MCTSMERRNTAWIGEFRIKHFFIDHYLDYLNKKPLLIASLEYVLFFVYILAMINITLCYLWAHDVESRLMWFDFTLYIGGIRLYDTIILILGSILGASLFKYFHLTNDKSLFKWTDILRVFKGALSPMSIYIFRNHIEAFEKFRNVVKITYKVSLAIYKITGKLTSLYTADPDKGGV